MKLNYKPSPRNIVLIIMMVLGALIIVLTLNTSVRKLCCSGEIRSFNSPDGNYRVAVFVINTPLVTPGGSGDRPGFIRLYNKENKILQEKNIPMIQLVYEDDILWNKNDVDIHLITTWPLPES